MNPQFPPLTAFTLAPLRILHPLGFWLLCAGCISTGCSSQDWAMGMGSEAAEEVRDTSQESGSQNSSSVDSEAPSPDNSPEDASKNPDNETPKAEPDQGPLPEDESTDAEDEATSSDEEQDSSQEDSSSDSLPEDPNPEDPDPEAEGPGDPDPESQGPGDPEPDPEAKDPDSPRCGDGIIQSNEECDDGNSSNSDACLSNCRLARCGDKFVWQSREECDPGSDGNATQMTTCAAQCGKFSELILDARPPTRTCYGLASGKKACTAGPWDCRGCREPR